MRPGLEEPAVNFQLLCRQVGLLPNLCNPAGTGASPEKWVWVLLSFQAEACYRALGTKGDTRSLGTLKQEIVQSAVQSTIFYPEMAKLALE